MIANSSRVNTLLLALVLVALVALIAMVATRAAGGPLDPAAPPSSTLPQVEPRSPIPQVGWDGASPITIGSPGSYFLTRNLTQVPITIAAENVTFDLSGFTLTGGVNQTAITVASGTKRDIVVRSGRLIGAGSAVGYGIDARDAGRSSFSDLQISGWGSGLIIGTGNAVLRVSSHDNFTWGIQILQGTDFGGSIDDSNFSKNSSSGIAIQGNNVEVRGSVMDTNVNYGVDITGSWNGVSGSRMVGNNGYGVAITGNRNVIVNDHIDGNSSGPIANSNPGGGNIIGPVAPANGTNPAENIGFP